MHHSPLTCSTLLHNPPPSTQLLDVSAGVRSRIPCYSGDFCRWCIVEGKGRSSSPRSLPERTFGPRKPKITGWRHAVAQSGGFFRIPRSGRGARWRTFAQGLCVAISVPASVAVRLRPVCRCAGVPVTITVLDSANRRQRREGDVQLGFPGLLHRSSAACPLRGLSRRGGHHGPGECVVQHAVVTNTDPAGIASTRLVGRVAEAAT